MPTNLWTLTYSGTEQPLASWGIKANLEITFRNKERDAITLTTIEHFDPAAAQFAWGQPILLQRDRVQSGSSFSGGSVLCYGYVGDLRMSNEAGIQAVGYNIYGPWWLLQRQVFQQSRQVFNGWNTPNVPSSGVGPLKTVFCGESYLGENPLATYWTGTMAIAEILLFANECFNPTKRGATSGRDNSKDILQIGGSTSLESVRSQILTGRGTGIASIAGGIDGAVPGVGIDLPGITSIDAHAMFPKQRVQSTFCAEAITQILRYFPTIVAWFDYTTTITGLDSVTRCVPTLWLKDISNLSNQVLSVPPNPSAPSAPSEATVCLAPDYQRQLPGVILCYKQVSLTNGIPFPGLYFDYWPSTISQYTPYILLHTAEIPGSSCTWVTSTPAVLDVGYADDPQINAFSSALANRLNFWAAIDATLADLTVDTNTNSAAGPITLVIGTPTAADLNGNPVSLATYPNILRPGGGSLYPWMAPEGVAWIEATLSVPVTFNKYRTPVMSAVGGARLWPLALSSISVSGNVATATTSTPLPSSLVTGTVLTISGATPAALNGQWTVTVTGASTFTFAVPTGTTSATSAGAVGLGPPTIQTRMLNHRVFLTNAQATTYKAISASDTGEGLPPCTPFGASSPTTSSLAYALYQSLSRLQYRGKISLVGDAPQTGIALGTTLTVEGPNNTYTGLLIQSVTIRPHFGRVELEISPAGRLDAPMLIELWRMTRVRLIYNMPSGRANGLAAPASGIDQTGATPKENTSHGPSEHGGLLIQ